MHVIIIFFSFPPACHPVILYGSDNPVAATFEAGTWEKINQIILCIKCLRHTRVYVILCGESESARAEQVSMLAAPLIERKAYASD